MRATEWAVNGRAGSSSVWAVRSRPGSHRQYGAIDAHHGSDIPSFVASLKRIRASDVKWLLPSHGPCFRKDNQLLDKTIERLEGYLHMADFGTCAIDWPLLDSWEKELAEGRLPR